MLPRFAPRRTPFFTSAPVGGWAERRGLGWQSSGPGWGFPARRARIIAACDSIAEPGPAPAPRGMSASAAARYLGKHPATLSRWIAEGKLTGEKVEGRFLLSPESVEAMREAPAAPVRPVAPLPDRLAHLAAVAPVAVAGTVKRPRKSKRG